MINDNEKQDTVTVETAGEMSPEELAAYLGTSGKAEEEEEEEAGKKPVTDETSPFQMGKADEEKEKVLPEGEAKTDDEKKEEEKTEEDKKEEESSEDEEFTNMVDYLNKQHDLGLNTENLPEELSREQEAEVVSDLFQRTLTGVNRKLNEYAGIEKVLEDEEVKNFIAAKQEGKTLKDYVTDFAGTIDGKDNESVIREQLSTQNPEMTEEEISDLVETYKDKNVLDKMADSARASQKEALKAEEEREAAKQRLDLDAEVQSFGKLVGGTASVYGIPLTDQIKKDVFVAVTQPEEDGKTYMDKMLQSDEGMFLAALGVLHMQELMKARASTDTNRANKKLVDKLFDDPSKLQSNTEDDTKQEGFNAEFANRW